MLEPRPLCQHGHHDQFGRCGYCGQMERPYPDPELELLFDAVDCTALRVSEQGRMAALAQRTAWEERRLEMQMPRLKHVEAAVDLEDCTAFCDSIWGDDEDRDNPRLPESVLVHRASFPNYDDLLDAITAKHVDDRQFWEREVQGLRR